MVENNKIRLVCIEGPTSIYIDAEITEEGDLLISGQDLGEAPQEFFHDLDYEYKLRVSATHKYQVLIALIEKLYAGNPSLIKELKDMLITQPEKDHMLLALLEKNYSGNPSLVSELQNLLESKGIPCKFSSYA